MKLRSWAGPAALGLVLASVAGGAFYLADRSGSDGTRLGSGGTPPQLRLASAVGDRVALGAPMANGSPQWKLEGTLSDDKPADGRVRTPRAGSANAAADLAAALGLTGKPTAISKGWALRAPDNTILILQNSGTWSWAMDCFANQPIESVDVNTGCASSGTVSSPGGSGPAAPPPGPSEADTLKVAHTVFSELGIDDANARTYDTGDSRTAALATPVAGTGTQLLVSTDLLVVGGNGWLSGSTEGAVYPLISAADAYDAMSKTSRPVMDLCMVRKDGQPGCEEPPPTVVTGATLGLMLDYQVMQHDGEPSGPILVPAWLFSVKGQPDQMPWIAVDPAYLEQPDAEPQVTGKGVPPASTDPGDGTCPPESCSGGSGSSGSTGSGTEPAPPTPVPATAKP